MAAFCFLIELIAFFACATTFTMQTVSNEYIYQVISERYNYTANDSVNYCIEHKNKSLVDQLVANEASRWTMYSNVAAYVTGALSALFLTSWSDKVGRKRALAFPLVGHLIASTLQAVTIFFGLPLYVLVMSSFVYGCFGAYAALMNISSAYLSDTTTEKNRAKRYTILEVCASFGGGIAQLATGYWIKSDGFLPTCWSLVACSVFTLFLLPFVADPRSNEDEKGQEYRSSIEQDRDMMQNDGIRRENPTVAGTQKENYPITTGGKKESNLMWQIRTVRRLYTTDRSFCNLCERENDLKECPHGGGLRKGRVWRLWFFVLTFSLYMFAVNGTESFQTMYLIAYPVCFLPDLVGAQSGLGNAAVIFAPFLVLFYEAVLHLDKQSVVLLSLSARIASATLMYFARSPAVVFLATSLGIFYNLTTPFLRTQISSLVSASEQGSALALLSATDSLMNTLSPVTFLEVYPATLYISYGFAWLVAVMILSVPLVLMLIVWLANRHMQPTSTSEERTTLLS